MVPYDPAPPRGDRKFKGYVRSGGGREGTVVNPSPLGLLGPLAPFRQRGLAPMWWVSSVFFYRVKTPVPDWL
jgi:hypothetical protein